MGIVVTLCKYVKRYYIKCLVKTNNCSETGLKKPSNINLSQIRTVDNRRLIGPKIAVLTDEIMEKVDTALKNSLVLK